MITWVYICVLYYILKYFLSQLKTVQNDLNLCQSYRINIFIIIVLINS